jgi:hypothetical protein
MNIIFTLCSNNYLAQAIVLGRSVNAHVPGASFVIVLVDKTIGQVDYSAIPFEVLPIDSIEPSIGELSKKYDIVELNTCVKPRVFEYLFENRNVERIAYLDPDIRVYDAMPEVSRMLDCSDIVLTPHAVTPIPLDGKQPTENLLLMFGIYNLGFLAVKRSDETLRMMKWWKERTYSSGRRRPDLGMFVDQLYMNLVPILFRKVTVIMDPGYNMAPWNLHERHLDPGAGAWRVNGGNRLSFFHFSSYRIDSETWPASAYNRYSLSERPDLVGLVKQYNEELKGAGHASFSRLPCAYGERGARIFGRIGPKWKNKAQLIRFVRRVARLLPNSIRRGIAVAMAD